MPSATPQDPLPTVTRRWLPQRVWITAAAAEQSHTAEIIRRCTAAGVSEIETLSGNRLTGLSSGSEREIYARAKSTLAVVVAPPSALEPQPIPPSADWRIDLARGCPAHCQYCYLAGSLTGPPVTRLYANLDDVLAGIGTHAGRGTVTSRSTERAHEGTTFELSCYTDPLGLEPLSGALAVAIGRVGAGLYGPEASLRFTTKYDGVSELLGLDHGRRTRVRFSVNAAEVSKRFEGGTASVPARLAGLAALAQAGYPAEIITHRFTPGSKEVLLGWYPQTKLEMDEERRSQKRSKFGGVKYVYDKTTMGEMKSWFTAELVRRLPAARLLYWT